MENQGFLDKLINTHIGIGIPWDLDRNVGGVTVLPPYERSKGSDWYTGTANAIYQNLEYMESYNPEYVLMCIIIRYNFENDLVNLWCPKVIIFIFYQNNRLAFVPALQFIRAGSNRCTEEIRFLHIFTFQQVLRQDGHRHVFQESHVRLGKAEGNGAVIYNCNLFYILIIWCIFKYPFSSNT